MESSPANQNQRRLHFTNMKTTAGPWSNDLVSKNGEYQQWHILLKRAVKIWNTITSFQTTKNELLNRIHSVRLFWRKAKWTSCCFNKRRECYLTSLLLRPRTGYLMFSIKQTNVLEASSTKSAIEIRIEYIEAWIKSSQHNNAFFVKSIMWTCSDNDIANRNTSSKMTKNIQNCFDRFDCFDLGRAFAPYEI